ncbi:unnamed protein product [Triticum turgidum subsp. durum]|uniref:Uncharacterized protein n=1 Tax=Triticum turgidum subsp. durum TaxID=4567 RepID=A0A9R0VRK5_TRITD|nr:unnamed protein product [Triticum turgidum subsp. durum]
MADPKERDHASPCLPAVAALLPGSVFQCALLRAALAKSAPMRVLCGRRGECPGGCRGAVRLRIGVASLWEKEGGGAVFLDSNWGEKEGR